MKETQSKVERLRELLKQEGEKAETYAAVKPEDIEAAPSSEDEGSFLVDLFKRLASIEKPPCSCSDLKEKVEFLEDRLDHIETTLASNEHWSFKY